MGSAAASLVVLLVWVYYSSVIVLLGAEAPRFGLLSFWQGNSA